MKTYTEEEVAQLLSGEVEKWRVASNRAVKLLFELEEQCNRLDENRKREAAQAGEIISMLLDQTVGISEDIKQGIRESFCMEEE